LRSQPSAQPEICLKSCVTALFTFDLNALRVMQMVGLAPSLRLASGAA
jgi:hypothetical protein